MLLLERVGCRALRGCWWWRRRRRREDGRRSIAAQVDGWVDGEREGSLGCLLFLAVAYGVVEQEDEVCVHGCLV